MDTRYDYESECGNRYRDVHCPEGIPVEGLFAAITVAFGAVIAPVIFTVLIIRSLRKYQRLGQCKATPRRCSYCGSESVQVQSQLTENDKLIMGIKTYQAGFHNKKILICKKCKRRITYIDQYDIDAEKNSTKTELKVMVIIMIICALGIWGYMSGAGV